MLVWRPTLSVLRLSKQLGLWMTQDVCHGKISPSCQSQACLAHGILNHLGVFSTGLEPAALQHRGSDEVRGAHGHEALADDLLERVVAERHLQAGGCLAQVHKSAPALWSLKLSWGLLSLCLPCGCWVIGGCACVHAGTAPAACGETLQMCCIQASGVCCIRTSRQMVKPLQAP